MGGAFELRIQSSHWGEVLSRSLDIAEDAFRNGIRKKGSDMRVECGCINGK